MVNIIKLYFKLFILRIFLLKTIVNFGPLVWKILHSTVSKTDKYLVNEL